MSSSDKPTTIILATHNRHKSNEFNEMTPDGLQFKPLSAAAEGITWDETGDSFEANARIKVEAVRARLPEQAVLADDSGLTVKALGGQPGIHSSRYAGSDADDASNRKKLLAKMQGVEDRRAAFVCCLVYVDESGRETVVHGECQGRISRSERGTSGFGYDSVFVANGYDKTLAELGPEIKSQLSHRAVAVKKWLTELSKG